MYLVFLNKIISLIAARLLNHSIAPSSVQGILFNLFDLVINELGQSVMILRIDTVLGYESGGDGCRIGVNVCSSLLLRATNIHAYLESLISLVIRATAEAA